MDIELYQVDAFADIPFADNPAVVCLLPVPHDARWMQAVACEMNFSKTAFLIEAEDGFHLRRFTLLKEVDLCGHATLVTAHIFCEKGVLEPDAEARFHVRSGFLMAVLKEEVTGG